jgi:hypothetical protein
MVKRRSQQANSGSMCAGLGSAEPGPAGMLPHNMQLDPVPVPGYPRSCAAIDRATAHAPCGKGAPHWSFDPQRDLEAKRLARRHRVAVACEAAAADAIALLVRLRSRGHA